MKIRFGRLVLEFTEKPKPEPETFQQRFHRENREFNERFDQMMNRSR